MCISYTFKLTKPPCLSPGSPFLQSIHASIPMTATLSKQVALQIAYWQ